MKSHFGLDLDGYEPPPCTGAVGACTCGPLGLVDLLEKQLGLSRPEVAPAERIVAAERILKDLVETSGSYARASFERDPLAVAEVCLRWRDELLMAGWNRIPFPTQSARLLLLLELDARLRPEHSWSLGDRMLAILGSLPVPQPLVDDLRVMDAPEHLPALWKQLLTALGAIYETPDTAWPGARKGSDLHQFQQALLQGHSSLSLKYDDSLQIIRADSEWVLARAAAQTLKRCPESVLVGGESGQILDQALAALDLPTVGFSNHSHGRAIPQVLALALRLHWDPLDPQHLLEFLTHPVCPVRNPLRRKLVEALEESPGVGGPTWRNALAASRADIEARAESPEERLGQLADDLENWIELPRFDRAATVSSAAFARTSDRVCAWAGGRATQADPSAGEPALFLGLARAASQLSDALRTLETVTQPKLARLLEQVLGTGNDSHRNWAELNHARALRCPGALLDSANTVLWWGAVESPTTRTAPWTATELAELASHGITPQSASVALAREAETWIRPALAAQERLIFFVPAQRAGSLLENHPLISRLEGLLGSSALPVVQVDQELQHQKSTRWDLQARPSLKLPGLRRWWKVPPGLLGHRDAPESFSSLEKAIYTPHQWVLHYLARLRPGTLGRRLQCDARLYGTLIHRLSEEMFNQPPPVGLAWREATHEDLQAWVQSRWPKLLREEGAQLLLHGNRSLQLRVEAEAVRSLSRLLHIIQQLQIDSVEADVVPDPQPFVGGLVSGHIDLLIKKPDGSQAVIDLKYGGRDGKLSQVEQGNPLQLATYARLLGNVPPAPAGAFFILGSQSLLTRNEAFFGQAVAAKRGETDLSGVWHEFEEVWKWRRKQLDQGWIELTCADNKTEPHDSGEPESTPPLEHWAAPKDADRYSDYTTLTGFSPNA